MLIRPQAVIFDQEAVLSGSTVQALMPLVVILQHARTYYVPLYCGMYMGLNRLPMAFLWVIR